MIKSEHELALMQTAKNITLEAHKAAARIMREGITTTEVQAFLVAAHKKLGSEGVPPFNAVLFGEATAYPHGVPYPQTLKDGDMVLIDTGAPVDGYLLRHHALLRVRHADKAAARGVESGEGGAGGGVCRGETRQQVRGHRCRRARRDHRGRLWSGLRDARAAAPDRSRHRPRRSRVALPREGRQDRACGRA